MLSRIKTSTISQVLSFSDSLLVTLSHSSCTSDGVNSGKMYLVD